MGGGLESTFLARTKRLIKAEQGNLSRSAPFDANNVAVIEVPKN